MQKYAFIAIAVLLLSACSSPKEMTYTQDSWETMIPSSCASFFDGCNNCFRDLESQTIGCTKMYCEQYQEPRCLDKE